ncbi:Sec63 Brl domain-containing protein [Mycena maculata]|uniref:Sec63 Brl domain-containing protein n=1 Tax=Mycena maculata TaxID=230809 RepID=A0AAD7IN30_9AGAR|nr:Sec63 Brl domain-containing protein [Mycena maculata]
MAAYHYDEGGNMAAYFVITFLAILLLPITLSLLPSRSRAASKGTPCQCGPCIAQRKRIQGSKIRMPGFKVSFVIVGWSAFAYLCWKVAGAKMDNKVYDPFEILGISAGMSEKEIKSTFKKLSKQFHPDKVRVTANETIEMIQERFVGITKAYKSLTDPVIRENLEKYGNPDGRQELTMGIALPAWIVAGHNNIWVLGVYGILVGGLLPALVGRWWFGNRLKTKDGIHSLSASAFFRTLTEDATEADVVRVLAAAYSYEKVPSVKQSTDALEAQVREEVGPTVWTRMTGQDTRQRRAMVLLYAYLLRLGVGPGLAKEQTALLLQTPLLLNALLIISQSRNWLTPTLAIMRLHAVFAQALPPAPAPRHQLAQLPGIKLSEAKVNDNNYVAFAQTLEEKADGRVTDVKKALGQWGRVEIVDVSFRVIGERLITPSSIVYLVVKLRVAPPDVKSPNEPEIDGDEAKRLTRSIEEREETFLSSRKDAEELQPGQAFSGGAHAPFWPAARKPNWWLVLADDKSNRVVVPPLKVTDVPFRRTGDAADFRAYKIQFQAPPNTGLLTWRVYVVSDSFVGEEATRDIVMKIDDLSALTADEQGDEDEISDPDEDTIAGQMVAMRGGAVKKSPTREDEESDEESSTDDDKSSGDSSDSDSD